MPRWPILFTALALLTVACGESATSETTTTEAAPTTSAPVAATTSSSVAATTSLTPTSTTEPETTEPETTETTTPGTTTPPTAVDGAGGSGCSPGPDPVLPDGEWFGLAVTTSAGSIDFDLACWFTGEAAVDAAAADGEESPPPNDYYVRNESETIRPVPVTADAPVVYYPTGDPTGETTGSFEDWRGVLETRGAFFGIWLVTEDGAAVSIREQWVP